jgi:hypothetical protein
VAAWLEARVNRIVVAHAALALIVAFVVTCPASVAIGAAAAVMPASSGLMNPPSGHHGPQVPASLTLATAMSDAPRPFHAAAHRRRAVLEKPSRAATILDIVAQVRSRDVTGGTARASFVTFREGDSPLAVPSTDPVRAHVVPTLTRHATVGAEVERELNDAMLAVALLIVASPRARGVEGGGGHSPVTWFANKLAVGRQRRAPAFTMGVPPVETKRDEGEHSKERGVERRVRERTPLRRAFAVPHHRVEEEARLACYGRLVFAAAAPFAASLAVRAPEKVSWMAVITTAWPRKVAVDAVSSARQTAAVDQCVA